MVFIKNFPTTLSKNGYHVKIVSEYSAILVEEFGFNASDVHDIRIASI